MSNCDAKEPRFFCTNRWAFGRKRAGTDWQQRPLEDEMPWRLFVLFVERRLFCSMGRRESFLLEGKGNVAWGVQPESTAMCSVCERAFSLLYVRLQHSQRDTSLWRWDLATLPFHLPLCTADTGQASTGRFKGPRREFGCLCLASFPSPLCGLLHSFHVIYPLSLSILSSLSLSSAEGDTHAYTTQNSDRMALPDVFQISICPAQPTITLCVFTFNIY